MLQAILHKFFGTPQPPREPALDPVLGELIPGEDGWTAKVARGGSLIEFTIGGASAPDPALLAHAHDILIDYEAFKRSVRACIDTESRDYPDEAKAELADLELDNISLCWPERPNDGLIFFRGSAVAIGLWRCDYIARTPRHLACDT